MELTKRKYLFIFISSFLILSALIFEVFVSLLSLGYFLPTTIKNFREFQIASFDPSSNHTTYGIVKMGNKISKEGVLKFKKSNNQFFVVSNFVDTEYECFGTCLCEEKESQSGSNKELLSRRNAGVLRSGLVYFIAAISSIMAINIAKEYFNERCKIKFSDDCDEVGLKSVVEFCQEKKKKKSELNSGLSEEENGNIYKRRIYYCRGHCVPKKFRVETTKYLASRFGCEFHYYEGYVNVDISSGNGVTSWWNGIATNRFLKLYLTPYCSIISATNHKYEYESFSQTHKVHLCCGESRHHVRRKNIKCRYIDSK